MSTEEVRSLLDGRQEREWQLDASEWFSSPAIRLRRKESVVGIHCLQNLWVCLEHWADAIFKERALVKEKKQ